MAIRICGTLIAASLLLFLPATAAAKAGCHRTTSPQGNSEADQYSETVPGPCGDEQAGGGGKPPQNAVPSQTLQQLQSQGAAGRHAAALAQATAPPGSNAPGAGGNEATNRGQGGNQGSGALSGIGNALGGDSGEGDGMGLLLPLILGGTLLAGILYLVMRRRAGHAS